MSTAPDLIRFSSWTATAADAATTADVALTALPVGTRARVVALAPAGDAAAAELGLRLTELGFLPGEPVRVIARAAFGGPLAVRIGTATFALRREEARSIRVRPET